MLGGVAERRGPVAGEHRACAARVGVDGARNRGGRAAGSARAGRGAGAAREGRAGRRGRAVSPRPVRRYLAARHGADLRARRAGRLARRASGSTAGGGNTSSITTTRSPQRSRELAGLRELAMPWILEGGSIDVDGEGTCLTTRQCLLNPNRNPTWTRDRDRARARAMPSDRAAFWLGDGLENDHTDGHVDNVARFVTPGVVVVHGGRAADDPNREALTPSRASLAAHRCARAEASRSSGFRRRGGSTDDDGRVMPASLRELLHRQCARSIVPTYGTPFGRRGRRRASALSSPGARPSASTRGPSCPAAAPSTASLSSSRAVDVPR